MLVRVPNWVGDAVISLGFLEALKRHFVPDELVVLAHRRVKSIFSANDNVISFSSDRELFEISLKLRGRKFGLGFALPMSFASGFSLFLAGVKRRVGFKREGRGVFLTDSLRLPEGYKKNEHLLRTFFRLLEHVGYEGDVVKPRLTFSESDIKEARKIIKERGLKEDRTVAIAPFASFGPSKEWGLERYSELVNGLLLRGYSPLILGASWERKRSAPLCRNPRVQCILGGYPLRIIASILKLVRVTISNDSGLAHLAAAAGGKVITIFGSTNPLWTSPVGERVHILYRPPPCSPCFKTRCPLPVHLCMENITPGDIIRALSDL